MRSGRVDIEIYAPVTADLFDKYSRLLEKDAKGRSVPVVMLDVPRAALSLVDVELSKGGLMGKCSADELRALYSLS